MGKLSRTKGHAYERTVAKKLREVFGGDESIRRAWQRQQQHGNPDVYCPGFHVECKVGKKPNLRAALRQAISDNGGGQVWPVAIVKDNKDGSQPPREYALMELGDWLDLVSEWFERS